MLFADDQLERRGGGSGSGAVAGASGSSGMRGGSAAPHSLQWAMRSARTSALVGSGGSSSGSASATAAAAGLIYIDPATLRRPAAGSSAAAALSAASSGEKRLKVCLCSCLESRIKISVHFEFTVFGFINMNSNIITLLLSFEMATVFLSDFYS